MLDARAPSGENAGRLHPEENDLADQKLDAPRMLRFLFLTALMLLLAACSSTPKPTIVSTTLDATAGVNPDSKGRASPIVVRLFELRATSGFDSADFFSLWDRVRDAMGTDLVTRDEFQLRPGEQKKLERTLQPDTRFIGVVAAFRDLERSTWRSTVAVVPQKKQPVTIKIDTRSIAISGK